MLITSSVVVDVVDLVRHEIFQLLDEVPDYQTRTIGVMNKCDMKQKKSQDWVSASALFIGLDLINLGS